MNEDEEMGFVEHEQQQQHYHNQQQQQQQYQPNIIRVLFYDLDNPRALPHPLPPYPPELAPFLSHYEFQKLFRNCEKERKNTISEQNDIRFVLLIERFLKKLIFNFFYENDYHENNLTT